MDMDSVFKMIQENQEQIKKMLGFATSEAKTPKKNILLVIDPQVDFHPGGSLAVSGANEDSTRTAKLLKDNMSEIDAVYITLDTHHRNHIAHAVFWENASGEHPAVFSQISCKDVENGTWLPRNRSLKDHAIAYTKALEATGRFTLIIWPEHCLIGSPGHAVVPVLHDVLQEWTYHHKKEVRYVLKGQNCLTEMYSAIKADYEIKDDPRTLRDPILQAELQNTERLLICGQAKSHCVHFTFMDILETWPKDATSKLVLLEDACSPVTGYEDKASEFVNKIKAAGCTVTTTMEVFKA